MITLKIRAYLKNKLKVKHINIFINIKNLLTRFINLKRFFSIYKLGEGDNYPELPIFQNSFLSKLFFRNPNQRFDFWNRIASQYKTFKVFYINSSSLRREHAPVPKDFEYSEELYDFYEKGITQINDFFDEKTYRLITDLFEKEIDPSILRNKQNSSYSTHLIREKKINKIIHNKILELERVIFGREIKCQKYRLSAVKTMKNKSFFKDSINFHPDRFIPSIKFLYFPFKVDIDPFEYYEGSHVINSQFKHNVSVFMGEGHVENQEKFDLSNYTKRTCFLDRENTLIIAATHGLHRRMPSNKEGIRKFITISWYFVFTRYDLLLSYLKK